MLNFIDKKNIENSCKKIGFLGAAAYLEPLASVFSGITGTSLEGAYYDELTGVNSKLRTKSNPFGLISESDIVVVTKTDKNSFNLIVESILNSKHIIIANPQVLEPDEFDYLEKLSLEGATHILAFNSFSNWDLFERLRQTGRKNSLHLEVEISDNFSWEPSIIKQKLFEIFFMLHFMTQKDIKKVQVTTFPFLEKKYGILKVWAEFDNACVATVKLSNSESNFSLKWVQEGQIIEFVNNTDFFSVKTLEKTAEISFTQKSFIHTIFEKIQRTDQADWFENQLSIFKKSLQQTHKIAFKLAFSKK